MHNPPRYALRLLEWFCPPALYEGIEGDLVQQFEDDVQSKGERVARRRFVWNTLTFFRPGIILRNKFSLHLINTAMLSNYFLIAFRNMAKRKLYAFINAFGLSIGIAFCMLIYLFIADEKSFDQFHENKHLIYRMEGRSYNTWKLTNDKEYDHFAFMQTPLRDALLADCPEVNYATRFNNDNNGIFRYDGKVFTEKIAYVDADFFKMFTFPVIAGSAEKLFKNNSEVVLTKSIAEKYFGNDDPVGKTVEIDCEGAKSFTVSAVVEDPPANSSIEFTILLPQSNRPYFEQNSTQWNSLNTPTFVQLVPNASLSGFDKNLDKIIEKNLKKGLDDTRKELSAKLPDNVKLFEFRYTALPDIHLNVDVSWSKASDPQYSFILGGIALAILLIACINYVALALTTSTSRRTEVGVRKVVGAQKNQLVYQFGIESLVLALISMITGLGLSILFLPSFNAFTNKAIEIDIITAAQLAGVATVIALIVGALAGSYPALFLSSFKPAQVLKGRFTSRLHAGFTKPLVVLQFALSASLIICSVIMYRQMKFITTKDLGFNQSQVVVVPTQAGWNKEADKTVEQYRARLQQEPSVLAVSGTTASMNRGWSRYGYRIKDEQKSAYVYGVDADYIPLMEIKLAQGRAFDPAIASDTNAIVVNESLVRDMKWTDPLNEYLNWQDDSAARGAKVIGVVKDYHFLSLEREIEPMFMVISRKHGHLTTALVKLAPGNVPESIEKLRAAWKELYPDRPFDHSFLDEDVERQYQSYQRWMSIMELSTLFAVLISCLGLFGLAGINAVNRTKEIGIRKVMGAELPSIFILLNKQFVWLSLIAFVIAAPLSWYVMDQWLSDFKFRITMGWELFVVSMLVGLAVALLTVSYHAIKAAAVNPAETLKHE